MYVIHKRIQDPPIVIQLEDGRRIMIHVTDRTGERIKLAVDAPREIRVLRDPDCGERKT